MSGVTWTPQEYQKYIEDTKVQEEPQPLQVGDYRTITAPNKYNATRVEYNCPLRGLLKFDSTLEFYRYMELYQLENAEIISDLQLQQEFPVASKIKRDGQKAMRERVYRADFTYEQDGVQVIEDTKGMATDLFKLKLQIVLHRYPDCEFRVTYRKGMKIYPPKEVSSE